MATGAEPSLLGLRLNAVVLFQPLSALVRGTVGRQAFVLKLVEDSLGGHAVDLGLFLLILELGLFLDSL